MGYSNPVIYNCIACGSGCKYFLKADSGKNFCTESLLLVEKNGKKIGVYREVTPYDGCSFGKVNDNDN